MSNKRMLGASAVAALALLSISAGAAIAADDQVCRDYAVAAVRQVRVMHEIPACNRGMGARWTDDWNVHYQWCRGATYQQLGAERDARTNWLRSCRGH